MTLDDGMFKTVFNGIAAIRCVFCSSKSHWSGEHTAKAAEFEKKKAPMDTVHQPLIGGNQPSRSLHLLE